MPQTPDTDLSDLIVQLYQLILSDTGRLIYVLEQRRKKRLKRQLSDRYLDDVLNGWRETWLITRNVSALDLDHPNLPYLIKWAELIDHRYIAYFEEREPLAAMIILDYPSGNLIS